MSGPDRFRVTVRMKSGGALDLGTYDNLTEAVTAVEDFKAERDDVKWTVKGRTMGEAKHSFVAAVGYDGVTDPSIVVSKVETREQRDAREWHNANRTRRNS